MLTGFLLPTNGDIHIANLSLEHSGLKIKKKIGYLAECAQAYGDMPPLQFLSFIAQIRSYKDAEKVSRIEQGKILQQQLEETEQ
ncbi:MAG: hypothetical protein QMC38_14065 [Sinobacterium sp.]